MTDQPKCIAILSANYYPNIGGVEAYTKNLAVELVRMGHRPVVVTNNCFDLPTFEVLPEGFEIIRLPCYPLLGARLPIPRIGREFADAWELVSSHKFDGILINTRFYAHTLLGLRLAKEQHLKPVVLDHGSKYLTFGNPVLDVAVRIYEHAITSVVKRADPVFCAVSKKGCEWLKTFGIEASGILPNAIDVDAYINGASGRDFRKECQLSSNDILICFVGRLIPEKGIDSLLEAMGQVEDLPVKLAVAGDGPLRNKLDFGAENVVYLGPLSTKDVAALYLSSDAMCLPTRSEGFCTSLLEASACGIPSIIPDVGGVDEVMAEPGCGYLLPGTGSGCIAETLRGALKSKSSLRMAGFHARESVEKSCSWKNTTASLLRYLE